MIPPVAMAAPAGTFTPPEAERRQSTLRLAAPVLAMLAGLWLVAWCAGLPVPNGDDAFFSGAAIHLAKTGELANPWIVGWMPRIPGVHLDRFFVQPPFPSYVLAAWLRLFGLSAKSMTGYACAVGAAGSVAAALLLLRLGARRTAASLGALIVGTYVLHRGLRPEPLGFALFLSGQYLLLRPGRTARWLAGVAILASPLCHVFLLTFAAPALLLHFSDPRRPADIRERIVLAGMSGLTVLLLFALAIRGEFAAFIHDLTGCARLVRPANGDQLRRFLEQLLVGWSFLPNLFVLGLTGILFGMHLRSAPGWRPMLWRSAAFYGLMLALGIALYAPFTAIFAVMAAAFGALIWSAHAAGGRRAALLAPALALVGLGFVAHGLEFLANRAASPPDGEAVRRYVKTAQPEVLFLDSTTLRYVFDFDPPAGACDLDWTWSPGRTARWYSPAAIGDRDLWVVRPRTGLSLAPSDPALEPAVIFGRRFGSIRIANAVIVVAGDALPAPLETIPFRTARSLRPPRS